VYKEQDNIVGYVRQNGIDAVKYEAYVGSGYSGRWEIK
jgi:hypothetical protein